jgi:hypothetical protein
MTGSMTMKRTSRHPSDPTGLALDRGAMLMQRGFEASTSGGDFAAERGSERAGRLVPPDVANHYLRQGERIADAVMAINDFVRRVMAGARKNTPGGVGHRPAAPAR